MQDLFFLFFNGLAQFVKKGIYVFKFAVNRSKPHIGNRIQILQFVHDQLPDHAAWDLLFFPGKNICLHFVDQPCDLIGTDRTLMAGTQHTGFDLGTVVGLPVVIFFDDNQRDRLYLFLGRKSFAAHIAYPTAANRVIIIGWTGINYSRIVPTAKRAFHLSAPVCPNRKNPGRFHSFLMQKLL